MVGLNFADEGEAGKFFETVNMKLQEKKRRNSEWKGREGMGDYRKERRLKMRKESANE